MDLWVSYKKDSVWGQPINLGKNINTAANEVFPYLFNNTLYFSSIRNEGMGGLDIYKVKIDDKGMPKESISNLGAPLNSTSDDFGIVFYPSADSGYFSSNFGNLNLDDDIYSFKIERPVIKINGIALDIADKKGIPGTKVFLKDLNGKIIKEAITDKNGNYSLWTKVGYDYILVCQNEKYSDTISKEITTKVEEGISEINVDFSLKIKPKIIKTIENYISINKIYFDFNKHNIRPDAAIELDKIVQFMKQNPNVTIQLSSHSDCRGDAKTNQNLSEKRAKETLNYMVSKGISKNRLSTKAYGESHLVKFCECEKDINVICTEEEHALNRRTEFIVNEN